MWEDVKEVALSLQLAMQNAESRNSSAATGSSIYHVTQPVNAYVFP